MQTIEAQVIPRLILAHARAPYDAAGCPDARLPPTDAEVRRVAELSAAQDMTSLLVIVEEMSKAGLGLESVLVDLVAPAARLLGEQWLDDEISFADVTLGLGLLQRLVAVLGGDLSEPMNPRGVVALVAPRGEQHTLAVQLLGELLRQAGWGVRVEIDADDEALVELVGTQDVVMVGLSISNAALVEPLERLIRRLKQASRNPDLVCMIGGAADLQDVAPRVGAIHCPSARHALDWLARYEHGGEPTRTA